MSNRLFVVLVALLLVGCLIATMQSTLRAQDAGRAGRYQVSASSMTQVFVVDTTTGELWTRSQRPSGWLEWESLGSPGGE